MFKSLSVSILLLSSLATGCGSKGSGDPAKILTELEGVRDRVCACKDDGCFDREYMKAYGGWRKSASASLKGTKLAPDMQSKFEAAQTTLTGCYNTFMDSKIK